jgi:hypothetical protein
MKGSIMKLRTATVFLACLLASTSSALFAQAAPASSSGTKEDKVARVMEVTGIASGCASIPTYISALFGQQKAQFGEEKYAKLIGIMTDSFSETNIHRYIRDELVGNYDAARCESILRTYEGKLFLDITARENEALSVENEAKVAQFDYSAIDAGRDKILDEFIDVTKSVEQEESMVLGALDVYLKAYNLFLPKDSKIAPDAIRQVEDQTRAALGSDENRMGLKKRMAQIYEDFSNEELERYFAFYDSDAGKWLYEGYMSGFQKALESSMKDAAGKIVAEFNLSEQNI